MAIEDKKISYRMYFVAVLFFVIAGLVLIKLNNIQWVEGKYYRKLGNKRTVKNFPIPANKGNVYSADGSLLATSIPEYAVYFDAVVPADTLFNNNIKGLSDSL
jgi:cell division protein FtsI (penicillin-binding protein 3)